MSLTQLAAPALCIALVFVAGSVGAAPIQVAQGNVNQASDLSETFDYFADYDVGSLSLLPGDFETCVGATTCTITVPDGWDYITVKASNYTALIHAYDGEV